jgi:hypothetical protein
VKGVNTVVITIGACPAHESATFHVAQFEPSQSVGGAGVVVVVVDVAMVVVDSAEVWFFK